jgi:RNA polymerase sigma-70 factor (ECF subfamily)
LTTANDHTDKELLERIKADDEHAFRQLFDRYWRKVYAMAYARVRSGHATEEIVQEIYISLWDRRLSLDIHHLPSYLFQAVKFKALNYIQSRIVQKKYWDYYKVFVPQQEESTQIAVDFENLLEAIESGMADLPEKSRKVFQMHRLEGWSVPEIARTLNLSEKAIEYHLTQSLKKLRVHLKNYILTFAILLGLFR